MCEYEHDERMCVCVVHGWRCPVHEIRNASSKQNAFYVDKNSTTMKIKQESEKNTATATEMK